MIFVGLSHRSGPVEVRERLALCGDAVDGALRRMLALRGVAECLLLCTCNRVEVYAVAEHAHEQAQVVRSIIDTLADIGGRRVVSYLAWKTDRDALRHMFRVACSLDSLVVGEPQILGQFKEAIELARQSGALGPQLRTATQHALRVAKRVRTETRIGAGQASVPAAAFCLARHIFDELGDRRVLVVGAGDMAQAAAKLLANAGAETVVVNRSAERANRLANLVRGRCAAWHEIERCLTEADIVISSTASCDHIITSELVRRAQRARRGRNLFLIDIAVPRDIEPSAGKLDGVFLYDVDDLSKVVTEAQGIRVAAAEAAEAIILYELSRLDDRRRQNEMTPLIVALRDRTRRVLMDELERSLRGKLRHLPAKDRKTLQAMLEAAANKLMHAPSTRLKALAGAPEGEQHAESVRQLFDFDAPVGGAEPERPGDGTRDDRQRPADSRVEPTWPAQLPLGCAAGASS